MYVTGNFDQTGEIMSAASPSFPIQNETTERPISVYDNLSSTQISPSLKDSSRKPNGTNGHHPFTNISFKFENGISNCNSNGTTRPTKVYFPQVQNNSDKLITGAPSSLAPALNRSPNIKSTRGSTMNENELNKQLPAIKHTSQRPTIDQNVDVTNSNLPSTVVTKPVISDAKSKFFGLNGNSSNNTNSEKTERKNNGNYSSLSESDSPLLGSGHTGPQVQIIPSNHKYQNIPSNSAIFRKVNETDLHEKTPSETATSSGFPSAPTDQIREKQSKHDQPNQSNRSSASIHGDMDQSETIPMQTPSQVIYMSTTVPQNIKGPNIAGRHTPTRNSLRHSRMLVVNKNYQGINTQNPLDLKHPALTRLLLIFLIIIGLLITFIGIWILLWAPNTRMQDNPYWSGLSLIFTGILGLIVIKFKRIKRQRIRENCFKFLKVDSIMLALVAAILCAIACSCAVIHLLKLLSVNTTCTSTNLLVANAACICTFRSKESNFNDTTIPPKDITSNSTQVTTENDHEFQYRDLSCSEVTGPWKYILIVSAVLNALGFIFVISYLLLVCCRKTSKRKIYNSVKTNPF